MSLAPFGRSRRGLPRRNAWINRTLSIVEINGFEIRIFRGGTLCSLLQFTFHVVALGLVDMINVDQSFEFGRGGAVPCAIGRGRLRAL